MYNENVLTNQQVANQLRRVAAVFEVIDADFFRTRAYQNAANAIENLTISAHDLFEQKKLTEIPGVGPNIANHLEELFTKGKSSHFEREMKRVPAGMFGLLGIRGIGPKIAFKLAKKFSLLSEATAKKDLLKLIKEKKLITKLKTSIDNQFNKKVRMLQSEAYPIAERFLSYINRLPQVKTAQPLGSIRRRLSTIGDIDIAICATNPSKAMSEVLKYPEIHKTISNGNAVARVKLISGHEVDLKFGRPNEWGSLLHHYTGSKLHNIALRTYAASKSLSLSEHGIKNLKTNKIYLAKDETAFYKKLGLPYIPPELREGEEEIVWAKENHIPKLIESSDIKGDLHLHSSFNFPTSHDLGSASLKEILKQATALGYEYIGLTDHNPKFKDLTITQKKKILDKRIMWIKTELDEYEKIVKNNKIKVLIGLEINIRKDGSLALEDELFENLDYSVVSIHSSFELSKEENTARIIKALSHPKAAILGHPTGRLINQRESIQADWLRIIDFCKVNKKILEVNASPQRLDLPDDLVKLAVRSGVKICINSDSHDVQQMPHLVSGVFVARRGWATKNDVVNTLSFTDLIKMLK